MNSEELAQQDEHLTYRKTDCPYCEAPNWVDYGKYVHELETPPPMAVECWDCHNDYVINPYADPRIELGRQKP